MKFVPDKVYLGLGCKVILRIEDDPREAGDRYFNEPYIIFAGPTIYDAEIEYIDDGRLKTREDGNFEITLTEEGPFYLKYKDALLMVSYIPPHDHRPYDTGGPAVGTYDVFAI